MSLGVRDVNIHECVSLIEFGANDVSRGFNPIILPSRFFEVIEFVTRVENW